jgi:hypothetical protein
MFMFLYPPQPLPLKGGALFDCGFAINGMLPLFSVTEHVEVKREGLRGVSSVHNNI